MPLHNSLYIQAFNNVETAYLLQLTETGFAITSNVKCIF